jgi:PAS domain S-box-containing protein
MSLKARLRISIVAFVVVVVVGISALYLHNFTQLAFDAASARADLVADQVQGYVLERIDHEAVARNAHPASLEESKKLWYQIVETDPSISAMLRRTLANADVVVNIAITGENGRILTASSAYLLGTPPPPMESFKTLQQRNWLLNLWDLLTKNEDYSSTLPLGVQQLKQPLFNITVVIRSVLLRHALQPALNALAVTFALSLGIAVIFALGLPSLILRPLERVSQQIDLIRTGEFEADARTLRRESREFADVQSKLNLLGQQYRGAKQDALQLRSNVEQLLQRLDEAVLLFDPKGRVMMAGEPAERMLGKGREDILGRQFDELFPKDSVLGFLVTRAVQMRQPLRDELVTLSNGGDSSMRVLLNVEILQKNTDDEQIGTLVTLRDAETRKQLEQQLDVSSRLAAISRLTSGVAHEIKNPLNAMALHLEVLKNKLDATEPEIEVIAREIQRLDNVVKTFLSFNKPIELQASPVDLSGLVQEVVTLVAVDAGEKNIQVSTNFDGDAWVNGDRDLLKQAILNVVINALEAMQAGGRLAVTTERAGAESHVVITDSGGGIPPEVQDKIFNLYFTTKDGGSGIGLAMTFRVVQLHSGTIDFVSEQAKGTTFRLRFPELANRHGEAALYAQARF